MKDAAESLPSDLAAAHAMIIAERHARLTAEANAAVAKAEAANAQADLTSSEALIAHLKLAIEKLRRELYGTRSERTARLLDQMELQLEDLEAAATEDELAAEKAAGRTQTVKSFERRRPARKPFPDHLPRERVVIAAPESCPCCGSAKLSRLGEDITETLEVIPRRWKVIQTVREKFSCRSCETITQPPAPFHVTPRGFAGPNLLAMILFEKFGQHQPLNRQSERYAREGIDLSVSTLADQVGACAMVLLPLHALIEAHVLAAQRLHGDDTTVPILAKGKTIKGHIWTYVRDDRPFGGHEPPAAIYYASRDRRRRGPHRMVTHQCPEPLLLRQRRQTTAQRRGSDARSPGAAKSRSHQGAQKRRNGRLFGVTLQRDQVQRRRHQPGFGAGQRRIQKPKSLLRGQRTNPGTAHPQEAPPDPNARSFPSLAAPTGPRRVTDPQVAACGDALPAHPKMYWLQRSWPGVSGTGEPGA